MVHDREVLFQKMRHPLVLKSACYWANLFESGIIHLIELLVKLKSLGNNILFSR